MDCLACDRPTEKRWAKWCSPSCYVFSQRNPGEKRPAARSCEGCGNEFQPKRVDARFCSSLCSEIARGVRFIGPQGAVITCAICGERKAVQKLPAKVCHVCRSEWERRRGVQWREANVEKRRELERLRGPRPAHREYQREYARARYQRERARRIAGSLAAAAEVLAQPASLMLPPGARLWCMRCGTPASPAARPDLPDRAEVICRRCLNLLRGDIERADRAARLMRRHGPFVTGVCPECDQAFTAKDRGDRFCSELCGKRFARRERRGRQSSNFVEPVLRGRIFERDGWRCQICGKKVNKTAAVPHPKAPTIDHIVPLAEGGEHSMANAQTAHFICNSEKGAGARNDQLRLVG